jgi:hypothetical protein
MAPTKQPFHSIYTGQLSKKLRNNRPARPRTIAPTIGKTLSITNSLEKMIKENCAVKGTCEKINPATLVVFFFETTDSQPAREKHKSQVNQK